MTPHDILYDVYPARNDGPCMSAAGRTLHFWHSGDFGLPPLPGLSTKPLSATTYKQLTHPDTDLFFWFQIQITVRRASLLHASRRQTSQFSLDHCESVTPPLSHRHRRVAATLRAAVSCFIAIPPPTLCFTSSSFLF